MTVSGKRKLTIYIFWVLALLFMVAGVYFSYSGHAETDKVAAAEKAVAEARKIQGLVWSQLASGEVRKEELAAFAAANPALRESYYVGFAARNLEYAKTYEHFWDYLKAREKPSPKLPLAAESVRSGFEDYSKNMDSLLGMGLEKEKAAWQAWNDKGNAKVYEIFMVLIMKEDLKKAQKLAKDALDNYVRAIELCGNDKKCSAFVAQNIDWLTRKSKDESGKEQGGLGELFSESESLDSEEGSAEKKGEPKIYLPGAAPGTSIKGAH